MSVIYCQKCGYKNEFSAVKPKKCCSCDASFSIASIIKDNKVNNEIKRSNDNYKRDNYENINDEIPKLVIKTENTPKITVASLKETDFAIERQENTDLAEVRREALDKLLDKNK